MKDVTTELRANFKSQTTDPFVLELTLYRKWQGEVYDRGIDGSNRRYVRVWVEARNRFAVDDKCIVTCYPAMNEVTIYSLSYSVPLTTITFTNTILTNFHSNSPAYVYLKIDVPRDHILQEGLGSISQRLDFPNMNEYDSGSFEFELDNTDDD